MYRPRVRLTVPKLFALSPGDPSMRHARAIYTSKSSIPAAPLPLPSFGFCMRLYSGEPFRSWAANRYTGPFRRVLGSTVFLASTPDGPSPWLVLGALVGIPTALWAYKVRFMHRFHSRSDESAANPPVTVPHDDNVPTKDNTYGYVRKGVVLHGSSSARV